jgi:excisionase family DNA binding protein
LNEQKARQGAPHDPRLAHAGDLPLVSLHLQQPVRERLRVGRSITDPQTSAHVSDVDYASWLTKQQAADAIGVTTKTVERFVQAGQIQQARWQREGRGPLLAVYQPDDVARIAQARRRGPLPPFLVPVPTKEVSANGNGHRAQALARTTDVSPQPPALEPGADLFRVLVAAAARVMSETSQTSTLFLTIPEASALTGLTQAFLRRMITAGTLTAIRDRGWRIRRKDLEAL